MRASCLVRLPAVSAMLVAATGVAAAAEDPRPLVARAWAEWSTCGEPCKSEGGLGSELWNARRRLADRDGLTSMAVAVEQGEESCLCGKSGPTASDIERQGLLLAEAVLLWHLAESAEGVRFNTQRLRNVVHKTQGTPAGAHIQVVMLRVVALAGAEDRTDDAPRPGGYASAALREAAWLEEPERSHALMAAASSAALPERVRVALLESCEPPVPLDAVPTAASTAVAALAHAIAPVRAIADTFAQQGPSAAAKQVSDLPPERRVWSAQQLGRMLADQPNARLLTLADELPAGPARVAFLTGVALARTDDSPRKAYEMLLHVTPVRRADAPGK